MNHKTIIEYDKSSDEIIMKIISNNKIIFYDIVTEDVLRATKEYRRG